MKEQVDHIAQARIMFQQYWDSALYQARRYSIGEHFVPVINFIQKHNLNVHDCVPASRMEDKRPISSVLEYAIKMEDKRLTFTVINPFQNTQDITSTFDLRRI